MSSDISGKIDTSKWVNQANIVTPNFKKSAYAIINPESANGKNKFYFNTCDI